MRENKTFSFIPDSHKIKIPSDPLQGFRIAPKEDVETTKGVSSDDESFCDCLSYHKLTLIPMLVLMTIPCTGLVMFVMCGNDCEDGCQQLFQSECQLNVTCEIGVCFHLNSTHSNEPTPCGQIPNNCKRRGYKILIIGGSISSSLLMSLCVKLIYIGVKLKDGLKPRNIKKGQLEPSRVPTMMSPAFLTRVIKIDSN